MSFVAITLCVASQRVFIVVSIYFFIDSVRKLLDTHLQSGNFWIHSSTSGWTSPVTLAENYH
jgi:hypothetical protein